LTQPAVPDVPEPLFFCVRQDEDKKSEKRQERQKFHAFCRSCRFSLLLFPRSAFSAYFSTPRLLEVKIHPSKVF
jgi:hypothetical protein